MVVVKKDFLSIRAPYGVTGGYVILWLISFLTTEIEVPHGKDFLSNRECHFKDADAISKIKMKSFLMDRVLKE